MNEFVVTISGKRREVRVLSPQTLSLDGQVYAYELISIDSSNYILRIDDKFFHISYHKKKNGEFLVTVDSETYDVLIQTSLQEKAAKLIEHKTAGSRKIDIIAPMPGMLLKIKKGKGERIRQGESIMILEAMKMENDIKSPKEGVILDIHVQESKAVEKGELLFSLE
jgi:biotin carboxyl carrier protein